MKVTPWSPALIAHSNGSRSRLYSLSAARKTATASSRCAFPLPQRPERIAEAVLSSRPVERPSIARSLRKRCAAGDDSLLQTHSPALPLPEPRKRVAEVALGHRPVERHPVAPVFLERLAKGRDCFLQMRRPGLLQ